MRPLPFTLALIVAAPSVSARADGMTLPEALRTAERHNEIPRIAAQRVARARAVRRESYALLLPVASASGTYRRRAREVVRDVGGETAVIQRADALSAAARIDVPLLDAAAFPVIDAAGHALEAARYDAEAIRLDLWLDVAEAFFAVLSAEQVVAAARQRIEAAELAARSARARFEAGLVGRNTATRAELEAAAARLEATRADNALQNARLSLGYLVGADVPATLVPPAGPVAAQLPERRLVERALELRPDLRAQRERVLVADALEDEPWLSLIPRLDASGVTTWTNESGFSGNETDWTVAVTATWVAYDGGLRYARAAARSAELSERRLEVDALRRLVRLEVRIALTDLASATEAVEQAEARVSVGELNRQEVAARFERGLVDAVALADATQAAFEAEADLARERFALRLAGLDLLRAVGEWPEAPR